MSKQSLIEQLQSAREVSTPLLMITSPDQSAVAASIIDALNGTTPVVKWDRVNGFLAGNAKAVPALEAFCKKSGIKADDLPFATAEPHEAFRLAALLPPHTVLIAFSLQRWFREGNVGQTVQAILNLRDLYIGDQRTFIGISPDFTLPVEIQQDAIMLDDPLPSDEGYASIITTAHDNARARHKTEKPSPDTVAQGVRAVRGLSPFAADQIVSMSIASTGMKRLDLDAAWQLKVGMVNKVKGLSMTLDGPDYRDLRGLDNAISILDDLWLGPEKPELIVRVDEMDKSFAGLGSSGGPGDNTGITQDMNQQFLVNMEDNGWLGALLFGVRGGGKTVLTQSIGKAHGVPTIAMDTGAMKGGIVGTSEAAVRDAFRTIRSIGGNKVVVLATCNRMDVFPAELLRRFKLGVIYFDLLTEEERAALWPVYLKKYGHALDTERPDDTDWTGAEIRNCCELAYKLNRSVKLVGSTMIVPFTQSNPRALETLRSQAEGSYLSASYPGVYRKPVAQAVAQIGRRMASKE